MPLSGPLSDHLTSDLDGGGAVPTPPAWDLLTGLVSVWDAAGNDLVGTNGLTGTGGVSTGTGKVNATCMDFERTGGGGGRYTLASASAGDMQPNQTMSYAAWVKPETLADYLGVISKGSSSQLRTFLLASGQINCQHNTALVASAGQFSNGVWGHIAVTWDQAATTLELWVDGVSLGTGTGTAGSTNTNNFQVGEASSLFFDGLIDQMSLWHKVLTPDDIAKLYSGGAGFDFLA